MKTFMPKLNDMERKWYLADVKGKVLGHAATVIADILRGKRKPAFAPHLDCGDYVVVINANHVKLTGGKPDKKFYYRHSGYPGGLKKKSAGEILEKDSPDLIRRAVSGMLPKNRLRKETLMKLKVFPEAEHKHEAQKPEELKL